MLFIKKLKDIYLKNPIYWVIFWAGFVGIAMSISTPLFLALALYFYAYTMPALRDIWAVINGSDLESSIFTQNFY